MTPILHHFSSQKVETERKSHCIGQHFPNAKTKPRYSKKIITQNIINSNPTMLKRNHIQQSSEICPRYAKVIQDSKTIISNHASRSKKGKPHDHIKR